jgi:hypothetical protein
MREPLTFGYADPPYLGCGAKHYGALHKDAADFDTIEVHQRLIERLVTDYPAGWAMSLHTPSLRALLPLCPPDVRVGAWVKPFCAFKVNVNPAYAWEPVIWRGGRKRTRQQDTTRDWVAESITLKRGLTGAKPRAFCMWIFDLLNVQPGDTVDDLFPGSGAVQAAIDERMRVKPPALELFAEMVA